MDLKLADFVTGDEHLVDFELATMGKRSGTALPHLYQTVPNCVLNSKLDLVRDLVQ